MNIEDVVAIIVSAAIGGAGFTGIVFYFLKRYLERRLTAMETAKQKQKDQRLRRLVLQDEIQHATGRVLFWLVRFADTGDHNGELHGSFDVLQEAEGKLKQLDREVLAENETGE